MFNINVLFWNMQKLFMKILLNPSILSLEAARPLCRSLPAEATKTLVQAFISCCLDYCNSLLYGVTDKLMRQVQSVQNAAARLITGAKRREHITPILRQVHWLPVRRRVEFKMAVQSSKVPGYLADDIHLASESSARSPRSSSGRKWSVTRVHSRFGDRCFAAAGPCIWNNLPASLRDKEVSCTEFRKRLKTFMFQTRTPPLMGASNAGGVGRNRDSEPISGSIACCERYERQMQYTQLRRTMASWWRRWLAAEFVNGGRRRRSVRQEASTLRRRQRSSI